MAGNQTSIKTFLTSVPLTKGYFQPTAYNKLEKFFDYFNLGVVIRELLTGKPPCFKDSETSKEVFLKDIRVRRMNDHIQECIWDDKKTRCQLLELLKRCTDSASGGEHSADKLKSKDILKEMERLSRDNTWERLPAKEQKQDDDKCDMCMVNPPVEKNLLSHAVTCIYPLKVCLSCMRNSYLNPLRCHSCFQEIDPVISSKYGAVLVAGQYDDDKVFSNSCAADVDEIRSVIISKCPLVIGIREKCVRTITQRNTTSSDNNDDFISQIQVAFDDLKKDGVKTIFFYYSGHCTSQDGFIMQKRKVDTNVTSKCLSFPDFETMLRSFLVERHVQVGDGIDKNFIIILDCCEAPILRFNHSSLHADISMNIVQLNACRPNQRAVQEPEGTGSLFKKIFIQALTMRSTKDKCFLQRNGEPCGICPITGEDFITIGSLNTYIDRHIDAYQKSLSKTAQKPVQNATHDVKIAYLVDTTAEISFKLNFDETDISIRCHFFNKICELKKTLFNGYMDRMKLNKEKEESKLQLEASSYHELLQIVIKTGPKDKCNHKPALNSLEQVMSAWNGKREIYVEMREASRIKDGPVGVFNDDTAKYISFLENRKHHKPEETVSHTTYKIDLDVFLDDEGSKSMKQLRIGIEEYQDEQPSAAEIHFIRPCMTDENKQRIMRNDFLCLKIEKSNRLE